MTRAQAKKIYDRGFVAGYIAALAVVGYAYEPCDELAALGIYTVNEAIRRGANPDDARKLKSAFMFARYRRDRGAS